MAQPSEGQRPVFFFDIDNCVSSDIHLACLPWLIDDSFTQKVGMIKERYQGVCVNISSKAPMFTV